MAVAAAAALVGPTVAAEATVAEQARSIAGSWKGGVYGDNGASAGYTAKVTIRKNARGRWTGRVSYPGMCSGKWAMRGKSGGAVKFVERITRDPAGGVTCVSPVNAKVRREGAKLRVTWTEPRSGDSATMLAKKV
ncbi:hypothetical protein C7S10_13425 [Nocardioides currus]|uniref:DUF2147 domain-containing protein n=1 Tax=Nocardioides currus TaxID=2133958 RepID=A0A2R7YWP7_9ACTN|nr:hypothetical protein C7S10_13425 [Nocardioides currus]